jgi:hypothetical protein
MEVDDYRTRYIMPGASQLANTLDYDGMNRCFKDVWAQVGTLGTPPATQNAADMLYLNAGVALSNAACPIDQRCVIVSPRMMANLVGQNLVLFNPANIIGDGFRKGQFAANTLGFDELYQDQNTPRRTSAAATTSTVTGAGQTGNTLTISALSAALNYGDVITIAGVDQVNPQNYSDTGNLQTFTVTAPAAAAATSITISPAIIPANVTPANPFATVTTSPANAAALTVVSSAATGDVALGFHADAFALVMADLDMPQGVWAAERVRSKELGISIRFVKAYDIYSDQSPARMDILYGWKTIRPELAVRIES